MSKQTLGIIFVALALVVGLLLGFIIGQNCSFDGQDREDIEQSAVGTYKTDVWNGKPATLILKKDGTCHYPTGSSGTWTQDKDIITINLNDSTYTAEAEIVDNGILLHDVFFEKVK